MSAATNRAAGGISRLAAVADGGLDIRAERYDSPAGQTLTAQLQQDYVIRYGGPDDSPIAATEFTPPDGVFLIGYLGTEPVAMGGLRRHGARDVELRRMFVRPSRRGRGLSRAILRELERRAVQMGAERVVLETGQPQPEAVGLYRSSGYRDIEPFGFYAESPRSIHLAKWLPGAEAADAGASAPVSE